MKTIDEIKKEYEGFQIKSDFVTSKDELIAFLSVGIDDTYDIEKDNNKEIKLNRIAEIEARIRNVFFFIFEEEEVDFYGEDNSILSECNKLVYYYRSLYERIIELATDENYLELLKLVDFATEYYNSHIDYFDYQRDKLETILKGFSMYNPSKQDNRSVLEEFINEKLSVYDSNKQLVKRSSNG